MKLKNTITLTAVAFGRHILTHLFYGLSGNNLCTDGCLDGNVELLAGNQVFQFLAHSPAEDDGITLVGQSRQGINRLSVQQDVKFRQFGRAERVDMIVEGGISLRDTFQFVVEVDHNLAQRNHEDEFQAVAAHIVLADKLAPFVKAK